MVMAVCSQVRSGWGENLHLPICYGSVPENSESLPRVKGFKHLGNLFPGEGIRERELGRWIGA